MKDDGDSTLPCGHRMMGNSRTNVYCYLNVGHSGNHRAFVQWDAQGNISSANSNDG